MANYNRIAKTDLVGIDNIMFFPINKDEHNRYLTPLKCR